MSDIGNRLRALFDEAAHPIDPTNIPHTVHRKSGVHRRFSVRPSWQIGVVAAVVALVLGGTALLLRMDSDGDVADQVTSATSPASTSTATVAAASTRWDWLVANSEPTDASLRIALASATPEPRFDYLSLGTEQLMEIGQPDLNPPDLIPADATVVYAGRHLDTGITTYFYPDTGNPSDTCVVTWSPRQLEASWSCGPATTSELIGLSVWADPSAAVPPGVERISFVTMNGLPTDVAVAVLSSDEGDPIVVRPVLGVAVFQVPDNWLRTSLSARAYDAGGEVIGTDQVAPVPSDLQPVRIDCSAQLDAFPCDSLLDGSAQTMWQAPNGGIDAQITLFFDQPVQIAVVGFTNTTDPEQFSRNARIKDVEIKADDLSRTWTGELADTNDDTQWMGIATIQTSSLTITVTTAYPGTSYEDKLPFEELALGEIVVTGVPAPETLSEPSSFPYLGMDLPDWHFESAPDEAFTTCGDSEQQAPMRGSRWVRRGSSLRTRITVELTVNTVATWCGQSVPENPLNLGPAVGTPDIIDHGLTTVMGHDARVFSEYGTFFVAWVASDEATAWLFIDGDTVTLEDVLEAASGVVELTPDEWSEIVPSQDQSLVIDSIELTAAPPIFECRDTDGVLLSPNRAGEIEQGPYASPVEALEGFIASSAAELRIARTGYVELTQPDGSITYGKPLIDSDLDPGFVTLIYVSRVGDVWGVNSWEASGC